MTLKSSILNGASLANNEWQSIDWKASEKLVFRLQMRIAKAMREKKFNKVKALQRLLTRSHSAKALAAERLPSKPFSVRFLLTSLSLKGSASP